MNMKIITIKPSVPNTARQKTLSGNLMRSLLILAGVLLVCSQAWAQRNYINTASLPAYYPSQYQHMGKISQIESSNSIIINGLRYRIASYAKVHTKATKYATLGSLRVGHEVGFTATTGYNNSRKITELWVLPDGSVDLN